MIKCTVKALGGEQRELNFSLDWLRTLFAQLTSYLFAKHVRYIEPSLYVHILSFFIYFFRLTGLLMENPHNQRLLKAFCAIFFKTTSEVEEEEKYNNYKRNTAILYLNNCLLNASLLSGSDGD